jgi:hypothetical protein
MLTKFANKYQWSWFLASWIKYDMLYLVFKKFFLQISVCWKAVQKEFLVAFLWSFRNKCAFHHPRANGAERRSGRKPGAKEVIPPCYLHPGKRKH